MIIEISKSINLLLILLLTEKYTKLVNKNLLKIY